MCQRGRVELRLLGLLRPNWGQESSAFGIPALLLQDNFTSIRKKKKKKLIPMKLVLSMLAKVHGMIISKK